jgi:hypothetical protein
VVRSADDRLKNDVADGGKTGADHRERVSPRMFCFASGRKVRKSRSHASGLTASTSGTAMTTVEPRA